MTLFRVFPVLKEEGLVAAPKTKNSPWFKHPTGIGWKCQGCGRCNSTKVKTCSRCKFLKGGPIENH